MNQLNKVLWGIVLIVLGLVIGLKSLGICDINLFFDGWWTLFIIVPSFIGLTEKGDKKGNLISLCIGIVLFLCCQGLLDFTLVIKLIIPAIFVCCGLSLIFNETVKKGISNKVNEKQKEGLENIVSTFSDQKIKKDDEKFSGAVLDSIFGGIVLDLRKADLDLETVIKASSIFGGIDILVPENVNVQVKSTPIFGGVENKISNHKENKKTIYIDAFCLFGGVNIR